MKNIKFSIEEMIFSFYSEGYYDQGISIKETYFPNMKDLELKLMLEVASRSLMAKDMIRIENHQYKLKEEYAEVIKVLNHAELTIKLSRFSSNLHEEDNISFHFSKNSFIKHRLMYENQVHSICKVTQEDIKKDICSFFKINSLNNESTVIYSLTDTKFEELLGGVSIEGINLESLENKWVEENNTKMAEFIKDLVNRKGKMDSIITFEYNTDNTPNVVDLSFIIPGINNTWIISRDNKILNIQNISDKSISSIISEHTSIFS